MTPTERMVTRAVAEQARAWLIKNRDPHLSAEQQREFLAWLQASPLHLREYLATAKLALDLRAVANSVDVPMDELIAAARNTSDDNVTIMTVGASSQASRPDARNQPRLAFRRLRLVAGLMAMGTVAAVVWGWWSALQPPMHEEYRTVHGEQRTVRLEDGSVLHINSDSVVRVDYTKVERRAVMEGGQALFIVAKDVARPFHVRAGATEVVAVGTEFDVRQVDKDEVVVTVVKGAVAVGNRVGADSVGPAPLRLAAGQQVRVAGGPATVAREAIEVRTVDVRPAVAWVRQKVMFERQTLREVAAEFNRYGTTPLVIEDAEAGALRISGVFNAYDLGSFVLYLESLKDLRVRRDASGIYISLARKDSGDTA